MYTYSYLFCLY